MLDNGDLDDYLTEYRLHQTSAGEPVAHYEDGELEAQWLVSAGFPHLTKAFEEGRELTTAELTSSIAGLPRSHAEAVKQRVKTLNRTVRGRTRNRHSRKPDIRDVFRPDVDNSSTGTRSRSATPDSLDSNSGCEPHWNHSHQSPLVSMFDPTLSPIRVSKQNLRRTPSAPLRGSAELFRGSHIRCDIPCYNAEGIELLGFQRLGTIHLPRIRSGSDPSCSIGRTAGVQLANSLSHNNLFSNGGCDSPPTSSSSPDQSPTSSPMRHSILSAASSQEPVSFENMCRESDSSQDWEWIREPCCDIATLNETDLKNLQPLLWLELASLFDRHQVSLDKRKPYKRKRKEEGRVFGVSLNALVRRDQQVTGEDSSLVPLLLQGFLDELMLRGIKEEGILRVPGNKQKIELLYTELEQCFYTKHENVQAILERAGVHDLSALLKRWLRELPLPLLANDLIHLFFQAHEIPAPDQYKAVSVLCLLLPHENRNTLRAFLQFLKNVVELQTLNKMSQHNVATIMAPSLFPPRFIHPVDKNDVNAQVRMAAQCCKLADIMIAQGDYLWLVPQRLIDQARRVSMSGAATKRQTVRKTKSVSPVALIGIDHSIPEASAFHQPHFNSKHVHKIVI